MLRTRRELRDTSALGEFGADAIRAELKARGIEAPSRATVSRILVRCGALEQNRRERRPPPPMGWYLPDVARGQADVDCFDFIEDLVIRGGKRFDVLTVLSLHGGLPGAFPGCLHRAKAVCASLLEHWREHGVPDYAQFDNDTCFHGPHHHPDVVGRVARLCLQLGVVPVFAPPAEHGPQNLIEAFNGRWQATVWRRGIWTSIAELTKTSDGYLDAVRERARRRRAESPPRRSFPKRWHFDLTRPLQGTIVYLRRTKADGSVDLFGRNFKASREWPSKLVRALVNLDAHRIRFYAISRRRPEHQRLLKTVRHALPVRRFRG